MTVRLAAAFAALCLSAPALAGPALPGPVAPTSGQVAYADLDLSRSGDLARLDRRIHRTAAALCGAAPGFDLVAQNAARRCIADAQRSARPTRDRAVAAALRPVDIAAR